MAMSYQNTLLHHGNVIPQHIATSWQCHTKTGPQTGSHSGLYIPDPRRRHAINEDIVGSCLRVPAAMHAMQQVLQHVSVCLDMILDRELRYSWHGTV